MTNTKIKISAIKRLVETGCAIDVTNDYSITRRPFNSTVIFHSENSCGQLSGLVLRLDETGELWAVTGRSANLLLLAQ